MCGRCDVEGHAGPLCLLTVKWRIGKIVRYRRRVLFGSGMGFSFCPVRDLPQLILVTA